MVVALLTPIAQEGALAQSGVGQLSITFVDNSNFPTVDIYLSVSDLDGAPLTDLQQSDFALYEYNVPITDFVLERVDHPMLIGVVIDSAVSFNVYEGGAPRVEQAKEAARWLVSPEYQRLIGDDEVGIYAFREGVPELLVPFTYDHQKVLDVGINQVSTAGNQYTAIYDLLRQAIIEMSRREGVRRRALLVFTDGVDRNSFTDINQVIKQAEDAHLLIYTVGIGNNLRPDSTDPRVIGMQLLAQTTGGRYIWYRPGLQGQEEAMQAFLDGLVAQRQGYRISYTSNQYQGRPEVRLIATQSGYSAEDEVSFQVPTLPPRVTVDSLRDGQVLEGLIPVQPSIAQTQRDIDRVEYYVDESLVYTAHGAPWTFEWDTRGYASSFAEAQVHTLRVRVCDIGDQCSDVFLTLGTILPMPEPTPTPIPPPLPNTMVTVQLATSITALVIAVGALIVMVILIRRGGLGVVRNVAAEVRRRTQVWRQRTGILPGQVNSRSGVATLTVVSEVFPGKQFTLEEGSVFLGREEERADIVLYWDDYISRRHAKIGKEGEQYYIWDLNSANGTWVNEQRVLRSLSEGTELTEAVPLNEGAVIRLGPDLRLRFSLTGQVREEVSSVELPDGSAFPLESGAIIQREAPTQSFNQPGAAEPVSEGQGMLDTDISPRYRSDPN